RSIPSAARQHYQGARRDHAERFNDTHPAGTLRNRRRIQQHSDLSGRLQGRSTQASRESAAEWQANDKSSAAITDLLTRTAVRGTNEKADRKADQKDTPEECFIEKFRSDHARHHRECFAKRP